MVFINGYLIQRATNTAACYGCNSGLQATSWGPSPSTLPWCGLAPPPPQLHCRGAGVPKCSSNLALNMFMLVAIFTLSGSLLYYLVKSAQTLEFKPIHAARLFENLFSDFWAFKRATYKCRYSFQFFFNIDLMDILCLKYFILWM